MTTQPQQLDYARRDPQEALARQLARANVIATVAGVINLLAALILGYFALQILPALQAPGGDGMIGAGVMALVAVPAEALVGAITIAMAVFARKASRAKLVFPLIACVINYGLAAAFLASVFWP